MRVFVIVLCFDLTQPAMDILAQFWLDYLWYWHICKASFFFPSVERQLTYEASRICWWRLAFIPKIESASVRLLSSVDNRWRCSNWIFAVLHSKLSWSDYKWDKRWKRTSPKCQARGPFLLLVGEKIIFRVRSIRYTRVKGVPVKATRARKRPRPVWEWFRMWGPNTFWPKPWVIFGHALASLICCLPAVAKWLVSKEWTYFAQGPMDIHLHYGTTIIIITTTTTTTTTPQPTKGLSFTTRTGKGWFTLFSCQWFAFGDPATIESYWEWVTEWVSESVNKQAKEMVRVWKQTDWLSERGLLNQARPADSNLQRFLFVSMMVGQTFLSQTLLGLF